MDRKGLRETIQKGKKKEASSLRPGQSHQGDNGGMDG